MYVYAPFDDRSDATDDCWCRADRLTTDSAMRMRTDVMRNYCRWMIDAVAAVAVHYCCFHQHQHRLIVDSSLLSTKRSEVVAVASSFVVFENVCICRRTTCVERRSEFKKKKEKKKENDHVKIKA